MSPARKWLNGIPMLICTVFFFDIFGVVDFHGGTERLEKKIISKIEKYSKKKKDWPLYCVISLSCLFFFFGSEKDFSLLGHSSPPVCGTMRLYSFLPRTHPSSGGEWKRRPGVRMPYVLFFQSNAHFSSSSLLLSRLLTYIYFSFYIDRLSLAVRSLYYIES